MWWWLAVGNTACVVVVSSREYCRCGGSVQEGWDRSSGYVGLDKVEVGCVVSQNKYKIK